MAGEKTLAAFEDAKKRADEANKYLLFCTYQHLREIVLWHYPRAGKLLVKCDEDSDILRINRVMDTMFTTLAPDDPKYVDEKLDGLQEDVTELFDIILFNTGSDYRYDEKVIYVREKAN